MRESAYEHRSHRPEKSLKLRTVKDLEKKNSVTMVLVMGGLELEYFFFVSSSETQTVTPLEAHSCCSLERSSSTHHRSIPDFVDAIRFAL